MKDKFERKKNPVNISDILMILFGSTIVTISLVAFTIPNKIASGGLSGLATILFYAFKLPVGMVVLLGNLILIAVQYRLIGFRSVWKTLLSVIYTSVLIEILMRFVNVPPLANDAVLACLYDGILTGIGVGLVFRAGGTTGGADIVGLILHHLFRVPIGEGILATNFLITIGAGFVFGPTLALYGLLTIFFCGKVIDAVIEGISIYRMVLVISKQSEEIAWAIIEELNRGVTSLDGNGMYTGTPNKILLLAVRRMEIPQVRKLICELDPDAFIIIGDARQVLGKGFKDLSEEVRREE